MQVDSTPQNIDEYIALFPIHTQELLQNLRHAIASAAPNATEKISYAMPTFWQNGNLVHFAAYKKHIGFYPAPSAILAFTDELKPYKTSKGAVQFPIDKPLPLVLIKKMLAFRLKENEEKDK